MVDVIHGIVPCDRASGFVGRTIVAIPALIDLVVFVLLGKQPLAWLTFSITLRSDPRIYSRRLLYRAVLIHTYSFHDFP